jgi:hypothetical protein
LKNCDNSLCQFSVASKPDLFGGCTNHIGIYFPWLEFHCAGPPKSALGQPLGSACFPREVFAVVEVAFTFVLGGVKVCKVVGCEALALAACSDKGILVKPYAERRLAAVFFFSIRMGGIFVVRLMI